MAALQTSFEDFIKISDPQQCLLKLTGRNCCSSYMKYFREGSCSLVEIRRTICGVSPGKSNHAMCLLNRDSDIQIFLNGEVLEVELTWMGL